VFRTRFVDGVSTVSRTVNKGAIEAAPGGGPKSGAKRAAVEVDEDAENRAQRAEA